ncbi:hypothetical protein [Devosia sp.]|uniref:hypothetical protein n=1 Tax=Devosia sp. TaxID=1871048 RepID=UPI002FCB49B1
MGDEPDRIIADYLDAFRAANPGSTPPTITQRMGGSGGWWGIRSAGSAYTSPKRLRDIVAMTERLKSRSPAHDR